MLYLFPTIIYFVVLGLLGRLGRETGIRWPRLLWVLPALAIDCFLNMAVFQQSWRNTMSGEAWNQRFHPHFGWTWKAIDWAFWLIAGQEDHCRKASEAERIHGSAWKAWAWRWRTQV